jgi:precorrin-2 dehydrogenase / sirohydrochlorin ferrochelatase
MKVFLPLNIRVDNRKILFVGGGKIALHKIISIEKYTRNITIIAPEIIDALKGKGFTEVYKEYEPGDLDGFFLVYASTNVEEVNRKVRDDAEALGLLVNVVDNRELSNFISPAIIKKDEMTIAVSSNGQNVKKSVEWRNRLRDMLDHEWPES